MQSKLLKELLDNFAQRLQVVYDSREAFNMAQWALMHLSGSEHPASFSLKKMEPVSDELLATANEWMEELLQGVPLQHLIGEVQFAEVEIAVNKEVLIPRPETEELVYLMAEELGKDFSGRILDIGTGSGCIALALKKALPKARVTGIDLSETALEIARRNAKTNQLEVEFEQKDILKEALSDIYEVIVSNPPYIPVHEKSRMNKNVLEHEPHLALFTPNEDPLLFYKRIVELTQTQNPKPMKLYFELHEDYAEATLTHTKKAFNSARLVKDLQDKWRFLKT